MNFKNYEELCTLEKITKNGIFKQIACHFFRIIALLGGRLLRTADGLFARVAVIGRVPALLQAVDDVEGDVERAEQHGHRAVVRNRVDVDVLNKGPVAVSRNEIERFKQTHIGRRRRN